jgi:endonuclease/exonuclease/phosphatase family metal-dependent hydrolase
MSKKTTTSVTLIIVKASVWVILLVAAFVAFLYVWGPGSLPEPGRFEHPIHVYGSPEPADSAGMIRVMTYNIGYGYGLGSDGSDYHPKSREEIEASIRNMADLIRSDSIDVVLIQEIDFGSKRSGNFDQLAMLAELTGLSYGAEAVGWDANYVPFPYWPPSYHFGRVLSGGAVLSRFPIVDNQVMLLNKPAENAGYYNRFYLYRFHQAVGMVVNGDTVYVVNNHLEAFRTANRMEHAQSLVNWVEDLSKSKNVIAVGGDMNALPYNATQLTDFNDTSGDDYTGDRTMEIIGMMKGFRELASHEEYAANRDIWHTFPADAPNRRLDYIFVNTRYSFNNGQIPRKYGSLSDHLPVVADIDL